MIYVPVSSWTWPPEVCGVVLHLGPLRIEALQKELYGVKIVKDENAFSWTK